MKKVDIDIEIELPRPKRVRPKRINPKGDKRPRAKSRKKKVKGGYIE